MNIRRVFGAMLMIIGAVSAFLSVISLAGALSALADRVRFGRGLMFADVEILAMLALILGVVGGVLLWVGRKLLRHDKPADG